MVIEFLISACLMLARFLPSRWMLIALLKVHASRREFTSLLLCNKTCAAHYCHLLPFDSLGGAAICRIVACTKLQRPLCGDFHEASTPSDAEWRNGAAVDVVSCTLYVRGAASATSRVCALLLCTLQISAAWSTGCQRWRQPFTSFGALLRRAILASAERCLHASITSPDVLAS